MASFKAGQVVRIPCSVQRGPFPGEFLIEVKTDAGVLSGFVRSNFLVENSGSTAFILGKIQSVGPKLVQVTIPGSFFTTASGLASVSSAWAQSNLESISA
ncbi:MAG TPA: hypothetical protein VNF29_13825 [Candidatus Binataceae bacterium]|nr:hypothetical protein [Candidatus Binataceae bacterium]